MARKRAIRLDDQCPREIDPKKKPNIKLYPEYEEVIYNDGGVWILKGYFEDWYEIPIRTKYSFGAMYGSYRLLLKSEIDKSDPNTGQIFPGDNRAMQFKDNHFETRDMFEVRGAYRSAAFGAGRIWDADTRGAQEREGAYKHMKMMLLGDKDFKARIFADLKAEEAKEAEPLET